MKAGTLRTITLAAAAAFAALSSGAAGSEPDSTIVLEGGREGTAFSKMTIEGEDRFRVDFERPSLRIALDPGSAPGLDWDNTWDVLAEGAFDLRVPLVGLSSTQSSPYLPRPWLEEYRRGDIVRFRPALTGVDRWRLTIADSRNGEVRVFDGKGDPPDMIGWDGLSQEGSPMPPGYTYSYVVEAWDRAGNRRNFVGKGFKLPSYRIEKDDGIHFLFPGTELGSRDPSRGKTSAAPVLLEAASRMNQLDHPGWKVSITATARTYEQANGMAEAVSLQLASLLLGDPALIKNIADVRTDAPETGTVTVSLEPPDR